jgi:hypothetical protein
MFWKGVYSYDNGDTIYHELNDKYVLFFWDDWNNIMKNNIDNIMPSSQQYDISKWQWVHKHANAYAFHLKLLGYHNISNEEYLPACHGIYGYPTKHISTGVRNPLFQSCEKKKTICPLFCKNTSSQIIRHVLCLNESFENMLLKPTSELSLYV